MSGRAIIHFRRLEQNLESAVAAMLTAPVTKSLPPGWQGYYSEERARQWIEERDQEGITLLVVELPMKTTIGLVILLETEEEVSRGVEFRLGYLLAESAWGRGLATELLAGFLRQQGLCTALVDLDDVFCMARQRTDDNWNEP